MSKRNRKTPQVGCVGRGIGLMILVFVSGILTVILAFAIWPGEMKLTAPLFCDDDKPDAFVVSDTYSAQPGETSTSFTLYCMGPRGEVDDKGLGGPFLVLWLGHAALLAAIGGLLVIRTGRRHLNREPDREPSD